MNIKPIELGFNFYKKYRFFNFSILKINHEKDLFGVFYNNGTVILTIFFKEFVFKQK
jgi:hypothetical protein